MRINNDFLRLILFFLLLNLASMTSSVSAQEGAVVCGTFYDCRYGDILLGKNNLSLAPQAKVTVEKVPLPVEKLDKKYAKMSACAHLNSNGQVEELHLRSNAYLHAPSCNFTFLNYGPRTECRGGEPVFVQFYSAAALAPSELRLYIDGKLVESGQVKHPGLIYYPSFLSSGTHNFRFEVGKVGQQINVLEWSTSNSIP